jgi:hypothetical protein
MEAKIRGPAAMLLRAHNTFTSSPQHLVRPEAMQEQKTAASE